MLGFIKRLFKKKIIEAYYKIDSNECYLCGKSTDWSSDSYFNVDISRGCCSWNPFCELVICEECMQLDRKGCVNAIMNLIGGGERDSVPGGEFQPKPPPSTPL